ncbi:MAG: hypothetical protein ACRDDW_03520 [Candidatus Rhabdochlamydia sp.]
MKNGRIQAKIGRIKQNRYFYEISNQKIGRISKILQRQWLTKMIKEGLVEKFEEKNGTGYETITIQSKDTVNACFSKKSKKTLEQIRRPIYKRTPTT